MEVLMDEIRNLACSGTGSRGYEQPCRNTLDPRTACQAIFVLAEAGHRLSCMLAKADPHHIDTATAELVEVGAALFRDRSPFARFMLPANFV